MRLSSFAPGRGALRVLAAAIVCSMPVSPQPAPRPSPQEIREIAQRAYTFAYPLVLMEFTRRNAVEQPASLAGGESNRFTHALTFPDATFRQVVRPNADTLYSSSWLDLTQEPVLLHVPDTGGRYYLMQFLDAWTETFSVPGKRTTGAGEGWFAVVGPGWKGELPARVQRIDAPTNMVWLIGRTQTNSASDYETVHAIQKGYVLMPLSLYPDGPRLAPARPPAAPVSRVPPPVAVQRLSAADFFGLFAELLAKNPPHTQDAPLMRQLEWIGIAPGRAFRPEMLGAEGRKALDEGVAEAAKRLTAPVAQPPRASNHGWSGFGGVVGRYGTNYAARAAVARVGLGALPPEDAIYVNCVQDSEGNPLDGAHRYKMHFAQDQLPPVRAFWSVTMYSEDGYFVPNPIDRFAIGDRDSLRFNADGSLDLYIQHAAPAGDRDRNWLPAPQGKFNLTLRLYWPGEEILSGRWTPPPVVP